MSLDINQLVRSVKQAAIEAVKADGPMGVCYGTVTAVSPLEITTVSYTHLTLPTIA